MNLALTLQYKQIDPGVINLTQYSNNTDVLVFELDNYLYETTDLSVCECYAVCYLPQGKIDETKVTTNKTSDGKLQIRWHVMGYSTELDGTVTYQIMFKNASGLIWTSNKAIMFVNSTIDADGHIAAEYPSLLTQWDNRMGETDEHAQEILENAKKEADKALKSANDAAKSETNASNSAKASAASANGASTSETNALAAEERVKELIGYEPTNMIEREVTQARGTYPLLGERLDTNDTKVDAKFDKAGGNVTGNIILANTKAIHGKDATGTTRNLIAIGATNAIGVGSSTNKMQLVASTVPEWNNGNMVRPLATMDDLKVTGWGVSTNQILTSVKDLNSVKTSGLYSLSSSIVYTNVPPGTNGGILEVIVHTPTYLKQYFHALNNANATTFMRMCMNSVWGSWVQVVITKHLENYLPLTGGNIEGSVIFNNPAGVYCRDTTNVAKHLMSVTQSNVAILGEYSIPMQVRSNNVPSWHNGTVAKNFAIQDNVLSLSGGTMTGDIILPNVRGLYSKTADGTKNTNLINLKADNKIAIGGASTTEGVDISSKTQPTWWDGTSGKILATKEEVLLLSGGDMGGPISIPNNKAYYAKGTNGTKYTVGYVTPSNEMLIGSASLATQLISNVVPVWNNGATKKELALKGEVLALAGGALTGDVSLSNTKGLYGKNTTGNARHLISYANNNVAEVGDVSSRTQINSNPVPVWYNGTIWKNFAIEDDVLSLSGGMMIGDIVFNNVRGVFCKNSSGTTKRVISLSATNTTLVGDTTTNVQVQSNARPKWHNGLVAKELATIDDIQASVNAPTYFTWKSMDASVNDPIITIPEMALPEDWFNNDDRTPNYTLLSCDYAQYTNMSGKVWRSWDKSTVTYKMPASGADCEIGLGGFIAKPSATIETRFIFMKVPTTN